MQKAPLQSLRDVQSLFHLLKLPGQHLDLHKLNDKLMSFDYKKTQQVEKGNYEKAAEYRNKELQTIEKIVKLLNQKEYLIAGILQIQISAYRPS